MGGSLGSVVGQTKTRSFSPDVFCIFLMFPIVAVETQILPVTPVRWVVVMVVIFMVYGQLVQILSGEFTPATRTNPRE